VCNTSVVKARSNVGDSEANWSKNGTVAGRSAFSPSTSRWSGSRLHCVHQQYIITEDLDNFINLFTFNTILLSTSSFYSTFVFQLLCTLLKVTLS